MNKFDLTNYISKFLCTCILLSISIIQAYSKLIVIDLNGNELSMIDANRSLITDMGNNGLNARSVWRYDNLYSNADITVYGKMKIVAMSNATIAKFDDENEGNTFTPLTASAGTSYYYVAVTNFTGCAVKSNGSGGLTVNSLPTITTSAMATGVCLRSSLQTTSLTYSDPIGTPTTYSITWNVLPANSFENVINSALPVSPIAISVPANTPSGNYTGTITVKNANGFVSNGTDFTVKVNAYPVALVLTSSDICASLGGNGMITSSTSVVGVNYQLYDSGNATVQVSKPGTGTGLTWSGLAGGNGYYVKSTNSNGCRVKSNVLSVMVNSLPVPPTAVNATLIYDGIAHTANATVAFNEIVDWYTDATGATVTTAPTIINVGTSTAWAEARNTITGCKSATRTKVTMTVTKAMLTVTADAQSKVYGEANPILTFYYNGFLNGDDKTDLTTEPVASTTVSLTSPVGLYAIDIILAGGVDNNYTFTYFPANFTVTKAMLTVTADAQTKECAAVFDPTLTYQITSGSLVGEDVLEGSLTRDPEDLIGTYAINQGTLAPITRGDNYELTYVGANLVIFDNIVPIAMVNNIIVQLDAFGNAAITAAQIDNGSNDACGIVSIELNKTNFDCTNVGANQVTLTVTDKGGNNSIVHAIVTIQDKVNPIITSSPANQTVEVTPGQCTVSVKVDLLTATDNCGVQSVVNDFNRTDDASGTYPVGVTLVTWTITDNSGNITNFAQTITVKSYLIANDDNSTTNEDMPIIISILANDLDCDNNIVNTEYSVQVTSVPANGFVLVNTNGTVTYTSNENFHGSDTFIYKVCDVDGNCDQATVTITINSVNGLLIANDDIVTINVDGSLNNTVADNDIQSNDGGPEYSVWTLVTPPSKGTVFFNPDGSYNYTPDADYLGSDSFTYKLCDGDGNCDEAKVTITIEDILLPNQILTPNGDNTNDTFIILGIDLYPVNKVTVYNRWGNIVYQRYDYQNEWDGNSNVNSIGSKALPIGTYYYLIDYGKNRHKTGFVYLDR